MWNHHPICGDRNCLLLEKRFVLLSCETDCTSEESDLFFLQVRQRDLALQPLLRDFTDLVTSRQFITRAIIALCSLEAALGLVFCDCTFLFLETLTSTPLSIKAVLIYGIGWTIMVETSYSKLFLVTVPFFGSFTSM